MASIKPSKQRALLRRTPHHLTKRLVSVHLSRELREKHGVRSLPVRVGDTVKILRGGFKGVQGKVKRLDRGEGLVYIEGLTRKRADGRVVDIPVHASDLVVITLNLEDEYRKKRLEKLQTPGGG